MSKEDDLFPSTHLWKHGPDHTQAYVVKHGAGFLPLHACTALLAAASLPALSMDLTACPASWAKWLGSTDGCFPDDFLS